MSSPTKRTLKYLRDDGFHCAIAEHWMKAPGMSFGVRRDLFGFIDVVAVKPEEGIIGVQTTSYSGHSARRDKITGEGYTYQQDTKIKREYLSAAEGAWKWLEAGGRVMIISWKKVQRVKKDGTKSKLVTYIPRLQEIFHEDLTPLDYDAERISIGVWADPESEPTSKRVVEQISFVDDKKVEE